MSAVVAARRVSPAVRFPIVSVIAGAAIFLASWLAVFELNFGPGAEGPWFLWSAGMLLTALVSVALLCRSRGAAVTAALLASASVLLSFAGLGIGWLIDPTLGAGPEPVSGRNPLLVALGDLSSVISGNRYFAPALLLAGSFLAVAMSPRQAKGDRPAWRMPAAGAGVALVSLFMLVVVERVMLDLLVAGSDLARIGTVGFVTIAAGSGLALLRWRPALIGAVILAVAMLALGLVQQPILRVPSDVLSQGVWGVLVGDLVRLVNNTPFTWSSLVLIGSWLGILAGRRSDTAHGSA